MDIPLYQIDAFTDTLFHGNPAAVCPLQEWPPTPTLAAIAAENNLAETAYLVGGAGRYHIRWFTPTVEIDLCGHATLAAAFVIFERLEPGRSSVVFDSLSGPLTITREDGVLYLDFPSRPPQPTAVPADLATLLGRAPQEVARARDLVALFASEDEVRALKPDFHRLAGLDHAIAATAPGDDCDFVSRFFAPNFGIDEDPVTGSSHCTLIPYWARRLGKTRLNARQVSARGGELRCEDRGERVRIGGRAVEFLSGVIRLP